ncbi:MAG: hypothetical protein HC862_24400 [Scytonema sp. RU_4_4]|nr:hypothetical protein [Scytonema sp. RU_4_4]
MINPRDIDLNSLPWLPLEEKTAFPSRACIYFAIDSLGTVQYVGRSLSRFQGLFLWLHGKRSLVVQNHY